MKQINEQMIFTGIKVASRKELLELVEKLNGDSENDILIDEYDLKSILYDKESALLAIAESQGDKAALEAINNAIEFAEIDGTSIKSASGVLVHFTMHPEFHFMQLAEAMEVIHNSIDISADVIFGTTTNESLPLDFIRVTLIAVEKSQMVAVNNVI